MSTEVDSSGVLHIDGPPTRGFLIAENPDGSGKTVEVIYKLFVYIGASEAEVREGYENLMTLVRSELDDLWQIQRANNDRHRDLHHKIIWWRRRPEFDKDPESDRWRFTARFDTTPAIPNEFWDRWATQEGAFAKNIKELI